MKIRNFAETTAPERLEYYQAATTAVIEVAERHNVSLSVRECSLYREIEAAIDRAFKAKP